MYPFQEYSPKHKLRSMQPQEPMQNGGGGGGGGGGRGGGEGEGGEGYANDLRPLFIVFRFLGLIPFQIKGTGEANFRLCCPLMLYSVLFQAGMAILGGITCKQRIDYIRRINPDFGRLMFEATYVSAFIPIFLAPFANLPESGKKSVYLSDWTEFQTHYKTVVGKFLDLNLRRRVTIMMIVILVISMMITTFPFVTMDELALWHAVPFFYSVCICILNSGIWDINGRALTSAAKSLAEDIDELLICNDFDCAMKLADYKMLWLRLSKLTQDKGTSMGFTYGAQLTGYFVEEVLSVYGLLSNFREGFCINNAVFFCSAIIFSWLIFETCNTAQQVTQAVGINMQEKLQKLCFKFPRHCVESKEEMRDFVETIVENPPIVNLSGFVVVNRSLQTSLISAMVTYLVVLIQLKMSTDPDSDESNKNATELD